MHHASFELLRGMVGEGTLDITELPSSRQLDFKTTRSSCETLITA